MVMVIIVKGILVISSEKILTLMRVWRTLAPRSRRTLPGGGGYGGCKCHPRT